MWEWAVRAQKLECSGTCTYGNLQNETNLEWGHRIIRGLVRQGSVSLMAVKIVGSDSLVFPTCVSCGGGGFLDFVDLLFKELELENQDLKDRMREVQEEQRMLLDRISGLQLQLSEVNLGMQGRGGCGDPRRWRRQRHVVGMCPSLLSWESFLCASLSFSSSFGLVIILKMWGHVTASFTDTHKFEQQHLWLYFAV